MKTHELIESALLDAFGLLDDEEREAFERAFAAASPAVQAQVRREQTRFASMDMLLPDAALPADLKARVLERVRRAIAAEAAPAQGTHAPLPFVRSRRVSPVWRAGALACAAAAVVFAVTAIEMRVKYDELNRTIQSDVLLSKMLETMGPNHLTEMLFDGRTERVVFSPSDPAATGEASVWVNPDWQQARLFYLNLPRQEGKIYKLAVLDQNGDVVNIVAEFDSNGGLMTRDVPTGVGSGKLAILGPGSKGEASTLMVAQSKPRA